MGTLNEDLCTFFIISGSVRLWIRNMIGPKYDTQFKPSHMQKKRVNKAEFACILVAWVFEV
jgi:hypothetical protein